MIPRPSLARRWKALAQSRTWLTLPGADHPGPVIPRPNWNAATAVVLSESAAGDAVLSTSPLAPAWVLGRCADWIRVQREAEKYLDHGGRDIYCGSRLITDERSLRDYLSEHARGWLIADPVQWRQIVDPGARTLFERTATSVDVGDRSILLWRWGG